MDAAILGRVVEEPKEFANFLLVKRDRAGMSRWEDVAAAAGVGPATVFRILEAGPVKPAGRLESRNAVAKALGAASWWELVDEWMGGGSESDRGIAVELSDAAWSKVRALSREWNISLEATVVRLASERIDQIERERPAAAPRLPTERSRGRLEGRPNRGGGA